MHKRKLIEVALPLEAINRASFAEKNRKVGKPQNLHQWWSRKPVTAARAMLLAQLIDDPSSDTNAFPTEEAVRAERARLHALIERAVDWDEVVRPTAQFLEDVRAVLPDVTVTDPFVGGGSLALAAAQLGVDSESSDLNPVAVALSRALVDLPSRFLNREPVNPGKAGAQLTGSVGTAGLVADVEAYGEWMLAEARTRLGSHYPTIEGRTVLAWVWARQITCPNPACQIQVPLVSKWTLAKKSGKEVVTVPEIAADRESSGGSRFVFSTSKNRDDLLERGTMSGRTGTECLRCGTSISVVHVRDEAMAGRMGSILTAIAATGERSREYFAPTPEHSLAANVERPPFPITGTISTNPRWFSPPFYGMRDFADLFTDRQLLAVTTFSELVRETREMVYANALASGLPDGDSLVNDGDGALAYSEAVAVYLALAVSRLANWSNNQCSWESTGEVSQQMYSGQAMGMAWDFSEANVLGDGNSGSFLACLRNILSPLKLAALHGQHRVVMADARKAPLTGLVVATDPPYFDNIDYSDLSDFFYVWQRRMLGDIFPDLYGTILVPKAEELVANAHRSGGNSAAATDFLAGFRDVFAHFRESVASEFPVVVYYASKQSESLGQGNSRWSTILQAMVDEGWCIVRTWPIRTENVSRRVAIGANSMSTSSVLVLRPRPDDAPRVTIQTFLTDLRQHLAGAIGDLEASGVAPVDMQQAAIGPGIEVFSRFGAVLEADGTPMSVAAALLRINDVLDGLLNEQEGDFDAPTRFAVQWYRYHGYEAGPFGDADDLARGRNTSVNAMEREGILTKRAGQVRLTKPEGLPVSYDTAQDARTSDWEALHHLIKVLERDGIAPAGDFLQAALARPDGAVNADLVKELAHLLFRIAEGNGWTKDALSFNALVTSWPEILDVARSIKKPVISQDAFNFDGVDE
ncbi:hypothetical protein CH298_17820 [Rhodococcoides fascians]|uniref:DUF1156 domain-containing protein n=1 Tax=Rhodococcoides fascians TaxID=1828 RepID=UPI000B9C0A42|nr:DUF1156 domain-containing protein [Rhodococcus fascians]OZE87215.1 hypothetical protein CH303_18175 [Rhodococcus fascians]OZF14090.1 hypothetical protein CH298_17820 [Rhodococcus fascians]OZF17576.1 hypothetical protein CH297_18205 [Rhodococcus fascians]OZF64166.1 hypothetical protein CH308_18095 [Rhodococcus fascians]OZF66730.1 hypothetical protein CH307_18300 [Rhodococcus fascians]